MPLLRLLCAFLVLSLASAPAAQEAPGGSIVGQVFDKETGKAVAGVTVTLGERVDVTGADGNYGFSAVAPGTHTLGYAKSGYAGTRKEVLVRENQAARVDVALAAQAGADAEEGIYDVEEFVVVASPVDMESLLLRVTSDELLNVLSAEELSKFAAGDVAEGLQRVAGVNVVEGQFAVIRGLEDRYSSTTYNSAPVPSPDPDTQSVQLDLFPSDVVSNLVVAKSFAPQSPSNSSGGSIDIITNEYPEEFDIKVSLGGGYNQYAWDEFLKFHDGNPMGSVEDGWDTFESDIGASIGGRRELWDRQFRFKAAYNRETDYETAEGEQEALEPEPVDFRPFPAPGVIERSGDLSLGQLTRSAGHFDLTESERADQDLTYLGFGFDVDASANHRIDLSYFYSHKKQEQVQLKDDGYFPSFDYAPLADAQANGQSITRGLYGGVTVNTWLADVREGPDDGPSRGPNWYTAFAESESYERERDLTLYQINGDHQVAWLDGLSFSWAANHVQTSQDESARGARYFYEPVNTAQIPSDFPTSAESLGAGQFAVNDGIFSNDNDIDETQYFGRFDSSYETSFFEERIALKLSPGLWWEHAKRDVDSNFLQSPTADVGGGVPTSQFALFGRTPLELGGRIFDQLTPGAQGFAAGTRFTTNDSLREIKALALASKTTFWRDVDLLAGVRFEHIEIASNNDPYLGAGEVALDGTPAIFPTKYLFFDRLDNPAREGFSQPEGTTYNDQLLGIDVPVDPATGFVDIDADQLDGFVNGEIDERRALPAFGINYRPIEGLTLRGAYSQTVARPSFREMGYYVTVEPATDDLLVGNPQLQLSDVTSWDVRAEYTWGDFGDLAAVSLFAKQIDDPIESIVIRDPLNAEAGSSAALYRTFFNNSSKADLAGIELEARKNLGFIPWELFEYVTIGANYTYIDATVDRSDTELARSRQYFGVAPGDRAKFTDLDPERRLFGQPEWIANADISFDQPDWGTKATLAWFTISDVLDAAGSASLNPNGAIVAYTLDQYIDSYDQLDFVLSQTFHVDYLRGDLVLKLSVKNLTNSKRAIIYDPDQTAGTIEERSFKVGRDLAFSLTYEY